MIRKAKEDEGSILNEIHSTSILGLCKEDYSEEQLKIWTSSTEEGCKIMIRTSPLCFVFEENNFIAGYISLKKDLSIWQLYVRPTHKGKGIGKALLEAAEGYLLSIGITKSLAESSITALNFYKKCGYRVILEKNVLFHGAEFKAILTEKELMKKPPE